MACSPLQSGPALSEAGEATSRQMAVPSHLRGAARTTRAVGDGCSGRRRRGPRAEALALYPSDGRKAGRDKRREEGGEESRREGGGAHGLPGNPLEMPREPEPGQLGPGWLLLRHVLCSRRLCAWLMPPSTGDQGHADQANRVPKEKISQRPSIRPIAPGHLGCGCWIRRAEDTGTPGWPSLARDPGHSPARCGPGLPACQQLGLGARLT